MLKRSRVRTAAPDMNRIAAAVSRPGIDPRIWCSNGVVQAVNFDQDFGPLADVMLLPSQLVVTARVGLDYAGDGWGIHAPVRVDDEVVVLLPSGDPSDGAVLVARLWSYADPPSGLASQSPQDLTIVVAPGQNLKVGVSGGGTIQLNGDSDAMALASKVDARVTSLQKAHDEHAHAGVQPGNGTSGPPSTIVGPQQTTASEYVKAGG